MSPIQEGDGSRHAVNSKPPAWRRITSSVLLALAVLLLAVGEVALYATYNLFDSDRFADRAVSALETDEVRAVIGERVADGIIRREPDLIGARPLLEGASAELAGLGPFQQLFRGVVEDLHRTVFGGDRDTVALKLADVTVLVIEGLQSAAPGLADDIPTGIEPRLVSLSSGGDGSLVVEGARIAEEAEWVAIGALLLSLALLAGAIAVSSERRRAAGRAGLSIAVVAVLLIAALEVGRFLVGARVDDEAVGDAARAAWDVLLGDLLGWNVALAAVGLVTSAAAYSLISPLDAGAGLRRAYGLAADTPTTGRGRAVRAVLFVVLGIAIIAAHELFLRLTVLAVGIFVLYVGVTEILRLTLPPLEVRSEEPRPRRRLYRPVAAGVVVLLVGATAAGVLLASGSSAAPLQVRACNGSAELCDRTIDEVAFPATHNSMSAADQEGWLFASHERAIPSQLEAGFRGLLIDTHDGVETDRGVYTVLGQGSKSREKLTESVGEEFVETAERLRSRIGYTGGGDEEVYLCHAYCEVGATKAEEALGWVRDFLVENPYEVLIVSIEDDADADDTAQAFKDSSLLDHVWRGELATGSFPTLRELIEARKRVIVMVEDDPGDIPWMHAQFDLVQETPFSFSSAPELAPPRSCRPNRGSSENPLLLLNHWIDTSPAPRPSNARQVNARGFLLERARACEEIRDRLPNLVAVDFFEEGDVTGVVDELNGIEPKPR